ncbi:M14 family zinc carboxypeptidase [Nocardioides aequoreus]|uniref:M14 family zinc carboxypeptidase n=1 Tax=Nocardioides aequoreus TaxID=397278 RepID=UPI0004C337E1|nr:M14 family zinc carboxypeptidase [Nocardioides aequoreus]
MTEVRRTRRAAVAAVALALLVPLATPSSAAVLVTDPVPDRSHAYDAERARAVIDEVVLGRSVRGRPIVAYRKGNPEARHHVVLLGQMHGDEPAGPRTVRAVLDRLRVDSDTDLWLVPTMNPDGAARGTRTNARGVDLNRNWPTSGWRDADRRPGSRSYRGPRPASEPETRVMMRFLRAVRPAYVASVHQPLRAIGRDDKDRRFVRRLARELDLPVRHLSVGTGSGRVSPTLTGWYNDTHRGTAVTVEYAARPGATYVTRTAPAGLLRATRADW